MSLKSLALRLLLLTFIVSACSKSETIQPTIPAEYKEYISGFTSGEISAYDEIAISFTDSISEARQVNTTLFRLNPQARGNHRWVNDRTVVFKPDVPLKSGRNYAVQFALEEVMDVPADKRNFVFNFSTISQDMEVEISGIESVSGTPDQQRIQGVLYTADQTEFEQVQRVITARQDGKRLEVSWRDNAKGNRYQFEISEIQRKETPSEVQILWNGTPIDADTDGEKIVTVSPKGAFELIDTRINRGDDPSVELTFSDPLDASQNLEGIVRLERPTRLNLIVNGNKLTVSPRARNNSEEILLVESSLRNADGDRLGTNYRREVMFSQPKPKVSLLGKGVIIPRSDNLYLPFKAVSLGAVDVRVTRIFENNIGQFLQDQRLGGTDTWSIRKVGRPVFNGAIPLSTLGSVDPGIWNNYALDLSNLIEPEPGAIYQVEIGFRAHQAVYPCSSGNAGVTDVLTNREWELDPEAESAYWRNYSDYYYPRGYDWRDRDDPCTTSYYRSDKRVRRNVLASDLGMIAKKAGDGTTQVFVTDIRTAEPLTGVKVSLFDYQQQELESASTDATGMATFNPERNSYYAVASSQDQHGYLRLDDGTSLSLSNFDVSGASVQKGVKGFLYGERGVWRPGDSLFVTMILEHENGTLPDEHPVIFELRDPSGQLVNRQTFNGSLNGFYVYETQTEKRAPTGNWSLVAKVGGLVFRKTLKIETVKPNRLKVEMDFSEEKITARSRNMDATLSSQWLHGATAKNLKADVEMSLSSAAPIFDVYPAFSFEDEAVSFSSVPEFIFEGNLDASGTAEVEHRFAALDEGPAKIRVNLSMRVFEPSGNFSVGRASTFYYPFNTILGIKAPETDDSGYGNWLSRSATHSFEVVSVDNDGNPIGNKELQYEVYNIRWRWWWERGRENLSNYFERQDVRRVLNGTVNTGSDGRNTLDIKLPEGENGGRYLVRVKDLDGGHSASQVVYFSWYGGSNSGVSPAQLTFSSDKESYEVGEEVTLNIPSSDQSKILVSLETGSQVLSTTWIEGQEGETSFSFTADGDMSPNVYAHVMHIQPHGQDENDLPIRMYGVIPISVEDPSTILQPGLEMADELRPETTTQIKVSEQDGRAMTYTLAMVDEGLLDLTNFSTPEPHTTFYAREALGVKTWDLFEYVTSGFSGNISRVLSVGGDASELGVDPLNEANRFKPMVRFAGPFYLAPGEVNHHSVSVPNYVGSVRTMVIAGQDGAYGQVENTTPVRKPVMVLATLPRVLGPAETVSLPVSVFAMQEGIENVQVRVEASDIFEIQGKESATVQFEEPGDQIVEFSLKTASRIGVGTVRVEVSSGSEAAYHEIEIAVRNPNTPFTEVRSEIIEEGESWTERFDPRGMIGTNTATLELSRIPPIDFGKRLRYLLRYPHGCIEQTTSSVFPQLYLSTVMDLSGERQKRIQSNVEAGIKRLAQFTTVSGGLAYWPGREEPNSWGTNYGYHFLLEAQQKGYYVPSELMRQINEFQSARARNWRESEYRWSDHIQAYRLYTLALANTPELGAMNRFREREDLSSQARWRLAAAYALIGQPEAADDILEGTSMSVPDYQELSGSYGSSTRDRAMILETLALLERDEDAALIARDLSDELSSQRWMSTQTTAYGLIGISKFLESTNAAGELQADFVLNDNNDGTVSSSAFIVQLLLNMDEYDENELMIENRSEGSLFARLFLSGTPLIGDNVSASNSLVQKVRFTTLDGEEIDPVELEQGTDFVAEVSVSNPGLRGNYEELALTQIFPSGWEIRNTRMDGESFNEPVSSFEYQDIRDDRIYTYFDLNANQTKVYRVQLNASYLGEFYLPAVSSEAMYDESINARTAGKWVKVVSPE